MPWILWSIKSIFSQLSSVCASQVCLCRIQGAYSLFWFLSSEANVLHQALPPPVMGLKTKPLSIPFQSCSEISGSPFAAYWYRPARSDLSDHRPMCQTERRGLGCVLASPTETRPFNECHVNLCHLPFSVSLKVAQTERHDHNPPPIPVLACLREWTWPKKVSFRFFFFSSLPQAYQKQHSSLWMLLCASPLPGQLAV